MPRRYYTPDLANRSLPLVSVIARDIRDTAVEMRAVWESLRSGDVPPEGRDELLERMKDLERRLGKYGEELEALGVEMKDPFSGLVDFLARRGPDDVYLCWKLGEQSVGHWHELEAGFRGRQPIETF